MFMWFWHRREIMWQVPRMVSVLPVMSFPVGPLKVSAGAVACVRSHCVSDFMGLSGRECR